MMKKVVYLVVALCVYFFSSAQDVDDAVANSYFRINDPSLSMGIRFYEGGKVVLEMQGERIISSDRLLQGRYFRLNDGRIQLAPLRRKVLFEVSCRNNPDIKKGRVRLTFHSDREFEGISYAFQDDTLSNQSELTGLEKQDEYHKRSSDDIVLMENRRKKLILSEKDGRDYMVMTYDIPEDANDLYIESLGLNEDVFIYIISMIHKDKSNVMHTVFNVRGNEDDRKGKFTAYYIRPLNEDDNRYVMPFVNMSLSGYRFLDSVDFYIKTEEDEEEYEDEMVESEPDIEEEKINTPLTKTEILELLHYNRVVLEPEIKVKGKKLKLSAEKYFTNLFRTIGNAGYNWYYFPKEFEYEGDTVSIVPDMEELTGLLDIYAEAELKKKKVDTTAARIVYRYYSEIYECRHLLPARLSPSMRYLLKYADTINTMKQNQEKEKSLCLIMENLIFCMEPLEEDEMEAVFKEMIRLAPAYRDFLIIKYNFRYRRWNYPMFAEYVATFKDWDIRQFRAYDAYLKKIEPHYYDSYINVRGHPVGICGELSWLLNQVAADVSKNSWNTRSVYLNDAVEWARLSTELCSPEMLPEYLDTYACLLYQTGNREKAVRISEIALRSLNKEQKTDFIGRKVRVNHELIKRGILTSEKEWVE